MSEFIKSQSPQELWKASLEPKDPFKPENPADANAQPWAGQAAKAPGTGLAVDITT
jgi:hypothetical protein